jgi:hypothetical protein
MTQKKSFYPQIPFPSPGPLIRGSTLSTSGVGRHSPQSTIESANRCLPKYSESTAEFLPIVEHGHHTVRYAGRAARLLAGFDESQCAMRNGQFYG